MIQKSRLNDRYNWIRNNILPEEMELVGHEIENIDKLISMGQEMYDWNSPGENPNLYITNCM